MTRAFGRRCIPAKLGRAPAFEFVAREGGSALVVVLAALVGLTTLGAALTLTTATEVGVAVNFRASNEALYAAEAVLERAIADLPALDWNRVVDGSAPSTFVDGLPGMRHAGDSPIDLLQMLNVLNCEKTTACSIGEMNAVSAQRPWGVNNPRWQPFAYGPIADLLPGQAVASPYYGFVLVADDPSETDGDPLHDGSTAGNPGSGVIALRAYAFGTRGARRVVAATLARSGDPAAAGVLPVPARMVSWREIR